MFRYAREKMAKDVIQRDFMESDLPHVLKFKKESVKISFPGQKFDPENFRKRLLREAKNNPGMIQVLESGGEVVGYVWFGYEDGDFGKYGHLHQLFIREDFRKRGLAKQLLTYTEKHLAEKGVKKMRIMVHEKNCKACSLYEKMDYRRTRLVMEKALSRS
jgi:ribosomal protein S18 acetylase RimI-like enzyme